MDNRDYDEILKKLNKRSRNSGILYALIPLSVVAVLLLVFWARLEKRDELLKEKSEELKMKEDSLEWLEFELQMREESFARMTEINNQNEAMLVQFKDEVSDLRISNSDTSSLIYQQIQQNSIAFNEIEKIQKKHPYSTDVRIHYHRSAADGDRVITALNQIGVPEDRVLTEKDRTVGDSGPINCIQYGAAVDKEFLKVLLLQLITEGFEIRFIERVEAEKTGNQVNILRNSFIQQRDVVTAEQVINNFDSLLK